jgi:hypothetical protein
MGHLFFIVNNQECIMSNKKQTETETDQNKTQKEKKFPKGGTYAQQAAFVGTLPLAQHGRLTETLRAFEEAPDPFKVPEEKVEHGVAVTVYHHSVSELEKSLHRSSENPEADSSDEEDGEIITAVAKRKVKMGEGTKTDKVSLYVAGEDKAKSLKIKINPDGSIGTVTSKSISIEAMQQHLLLGKKKQEGFVVKATGNNQTDPEKPEDRGDVYATFSRPGNKGDES